MQVLDACHSNVFLETAYTNGTLEYKEGGQHSLHKECFVAYSAGTNRRSHPLRVRTLVSS